MTAVVLFLLMSFPIWAVLGSIIVAIKLSEKLVRLPWHTLWLTITASQVLLFAPISIDGVEGFGFLSPWYLSGYFGLHYANFQAELFLGAFMFFVVVAGIATIKAKRKLRQ